MAEGVGEAYYRFSVKSKDNVTEGQPLQITLECAKIWPRRKSGGKSLLKRRS
jgi:hypothetical protein